MTWTTVVDYTPSGGPVAAGGVGNGWTDVGSAASIDSSNNLCLPSSTNNPWDTQTLLRLASGESLVDNRVVMRANSVVPYIMFRAHGAAATISALAAIPGGSLFPVTGGTLGSAASGTTTGSAPTSTLFDYDATCVQTNATTTTITITRYNVTSAGSALLSGTQGDTTTWTVTDSAWQNVAGGVGLFVYGSGPVIQLTRFQDFTDAGLGAATKLAITPATYNATATSPHAYTVATDGTLSATKTIALSDGGAGGTFSPTSLTLAPQSGAISSTTFTYTPAAAGSVTLTASTSGLTSGTSALTVAAAPAAATALSMSPSTATIVAGGTGTFTVATNGTISASKTIVLTDGGAGGSFNPSSLTLSPVSGQPSSGTVVYTAPGSAGSATITASTTGLTSATAAVTVSAAPAGTLYLNGSGVALSPFNWTREGNNGAWTWNAGAYVRFYVSGGTTLTLNLSGAGYYLTYWVDNGPVTGSNPASTLAISLPDTGAHVVTVSLEYISQGAGRWSGSTGMHIASAVLNAGSAGTAVVGAKKAMIVGDSITEGISANNPYASNAMDFSGLIAQALTRDGWEVGIIGCGYQGYTAVGGTAGDVPPFYTIGDDTNSTWNKVSAGVYRTNGQAGLFLTQPNLIVDVFGTNDHGDATTLQSTMVALWQHWRASAPSAKILKVIPFGDFRKTEILAAAAAYQASASGGNDANFSVVSMDVAPRIAGWSTDSLHPNQTGHANIAPRMLMAISDVLSSGAPTPTRPWLHG